MIVDEPLFRDQPDYCDGIERPNPAALALAIITRYLEGDPPQNDDERDHEARDPESWRRLSIQRTRWRIARHHAEMVEAMEREAMGWPPSRPPEPLGLWLGQGNPPWDQ